MSAHTKGNWQVATCAPGSVWAGDTQIAACDWTPDCDGADYRVAQQAERHANARLVAAAPELLAAARETVMVLEDQFHIPRDRLSDKEYIYDEMGSSCAAAYFSARAAIRKSEGRA